MRGVSVDVCVSMCVCLESECCVSRCVYIFGVSVSCVFVCACVC